MQSTEQLSSPALQLFPSGILHQLFGTRVRPPHVTEAGAKAWLVAFAWGPLILLSALERTLFDSDLPLSRDFSAHVRMLVELPALLSAGVLVQSLARRAAAYIYDAGLVRSEKHEAFRALVASTDRANRSRIVAAIILCAAAAASWQELTSSAAVTAGTIERSWRTRGGSLTNAGLWFVLVARPILYAQFALWVYRFALWSRVLIRTSRMLRPVAAHPDGAGGLGPLNPAHTGFAVIPFVIGADLAAGLANRLVHVGAELSQYRTLMATIIAATVIVFLAPMLSFVPALYRAQVEATFAFGGASVVGARAIDQRLDDAPIHEPHATVAEGFKAYLDISESLLRLRRLTPMPVYRRTFLMYLAAVLVPFAVAALAELPVVELLERVQGLLRLEPLARK